MYQIEEFPELWVDACLRNSEGRMLFLSVYGRDSPLMQFMSAMELGSKHEHGVDRFHILQRAGTHQVLARQVVEVMGTGRLSKHSARLPRQNLFGPMSQMWLYDKSLQSPDRANRIAWVLQYPGAPGGESRAGLAGPQTAGAAGNGLADKVWRTVLDLSPVALLDTWRVPLMTWCLEKGAIAQVGETNDGSEPLYPVIGPVTAVRISLSDHFVAFISAGVREGLLPT